MTRHRLIVFLALLIIVLALLSERQPPRREQSHILKFPKVA